MPSLRLPRPGRPRRDAGMCGLWYLPLQAAWGVALIQRAAHEILHDVRNLDQWVAHTINRRLTEQWAWETIDRLRPVDDDN